jgi:hypothetical protein
VAATIGLRDTDDALQCFEMLGPIYSITVVHIPQDLRPVAPLGGPHNVRLFTFNAVFLGQTAASRCEGLSTFRERLRPFLEGVLVVW